MHRTTLRRHTARVELLAVLCVLVAVPGCDCDTSTGPAQNTGTIVVNAEPDALSAPWGLDGPGSCSDSGSGDETLTDMPVGAYTLTWGAVSGYVTPSPGTGTLGAVETLTFTGTYVEEGGFEPPDMVLVPAGMFIMGDGEAYCGVDEREVTLTCDFYLGQHEVTNHEYVEAVQWAYDYGYVTATTATVRDNLDSGAVELLDLDGDCEIAYSNGVFSLRSVGGHGINPDHPVKDVTWYGAARYCDWLSLRWGLPRAYQHSGDWSCNGANPYGAAGYRLPTDAEWEYAAQYNDDRIYPWGDEPPDCSHSNFGYCVDWTSPAGSCPAGASALGLADMAGNVWEWCNDWHVCDLGTAPVENPVGQATGTYRVVRGGSWSSDATPLRCAHRDGYGTPESSYTYVGFRAARTSNP